MPLPRFDRLLFRGNAGLSRIGSGDIGGKAQGLLRAQQLLAAQFADAALPVSVPRAAVIATDVFDAFLQRNDLREATAGDLPDDRIAHAFMQAELPAEVVGDLRALVAETGAPLAVRSSSRLEDALLRPFAGVYATKMIPNHEPEADLRFRRLCEAIKLVYASTFARAARDYARSVAADVAAEKMAVIVQEVVGDRYGQRFYPAVSGVARSWNYYPAADVPPAAGVVSLALGLGKTIVDGGVCWSYAPPLPQAPPPYADVGDLLRRSQSRFWAVNMGRPPSYDPTRETEYLLQAGLDDADYDDTLRFVASTYDPGSDRLSPGTHGQGPRAVTFAPLLQLEVLPLNDLLRQLLAAFERELGGAVEIEFALAIRSGPPAHGRLGFLQVRPMAAGGDAIDLDAKALQHPQALLCSDRVMGNGVDDTIADVVYVRPENFTAAATPQIAAELARIDQALLAAGRPYLLIGFGRWGSSDPWLGIPVDWSQIAGARVIVESTLPTMDTEPSQGSHFFHNLASFRVGYFMVHHDARPGIAWHRLDALPAVAESQLIRHVRLVQPLHVAIDGRSARGVIVLPEPTAAVAP